MLSAYSEPIEFGGGNKVQLNDKLDILNPFSEYTFDVCPVYGCLVSKGFNRLNGRSGCWERDSVCRRYTSNFYTKYYDKRT